MICHSSPCGMLPPDPTRCRYRTQSQDISQRILGAMYESGDRGSGTRPVSYFGAEEQQVVGVLRVVYDLTLGLKGEICLSKVLSIIRRSKDLSSTAPSRHRHVPCQNHLDKEQEGDQVSEGAHAFTATVSLGHVPRAG